MTDMLYVWAFNFFRFLIRILPAPVTDTIIKGLAWLIYMFDKKHRKIAEVNLDLAYGDTLSKEEKEKIIKTVYQNMLFSLMDFVKNQGISKEALLKKVTFKNEAVLEKARAEGKKVILVTAHYGNWELVALAIAAKFGKMTIIGRSLDAPRMNEILKQNREQFDIELVDKQGAMKAMIQALKTDRMLGLLVDQNTAGSEGLLIDFFGKPARHTPSAAILARRFDAVIIPVFISTVDHRHFTLTFYDPIDTPKSDDKDADIHDSVQKQATITEQVIRQKPEEWFWLHQRWKNQFEERYRQ